MFRLSVRLSPTGSRSKMKNRSKTKIAVNVPQG